jgi:hypothetical protein
MTKEQIMDLALSTSDAYSYDNYGDRGWRAAITMLAKRAYTAQQIEAIMRSKWTRWAGDQASGRKGWRYGRTNGADLARFLDTMRPVDRAQQVADLVAEPFPTFPKVQD